MVQKYAKQSENAETNKSKWIILSNCRQDDVKHVLTAEPAAENNTTGADKMDTKRETCQLGVAVSVWRASTYFLRAQCVRRHHRDRQNVSDAQ